MHGASPQSFPIPGGDRLLTIHHAVLSTIDKPQTLGHTMPSPIKQQLLIGGLHRFHMTCDDAHTTTGI
jgi:hypothetical protein